MERMELEMKEKAESLGYSRVYGAVSTDDYWEVERMAHERARERLAYVGGKRVPYVVKMSVKAAVVDREKEFLEDNFRRSVVCADVVVFNNLREKREFLRRGDLVFTRHE